MLKMNYTEILDKIKDLFNDGDEYVGIRIDCENIKAVATGGRHYAEYCPFSPEYVTDIEGIFRTIENYITTVNSKLIQVAQLVCDIANGKIPTETVATETEVEE